MGCDVLIDNFSSNKSGMREVNGIIYVCLHASSCQFGDITRYRWRLDVYQFMAIRLCRDAVGPLYQVAVSLTARQNYGTLS